MVKHTDWLTYCQSKLRIIENAIVLLGLSTRSPLSSTLFGATSRGLPTTRSGGRRRRRPQQDCWPAEQNFEILITQKTENFVIYPLLCWKFQFRDVLASSRRFDHGRVSASLPLPVVGGSKLPASGRLPIYKTTTIEIRPGQYY